MENIKIPYDLFESPKELLIIIPLGWVEKKSVHAHIKDYTLIITGERQFPQTKKDLVPAKEHCYRWPVEMRIPLPPTLYFEKIHSSLSATNILSIVIPKNIIPEQIAIEIEKGK